MGKTLEGGKFKRKVKAERKKRKFDTTLDVFRWRGEGRGSGPLAQKTFQAITVAVKKGSYARWAYFSYVRTKIRIKPILSNELYLRQ